MSIMIDSDGFNTPRSILEYAYTQNAEDKEIVVLRKTLADETYRFIATGFDSNISELRRQGYTIVEEFLLNSKVVWDRDRFTRNERCC